MAGSLVGIDMNVVFQLVNTVVLYLLLRHFLFRPVSAHLAGRRSKIESDLQSARESKMEAERLKEEYRQRLDRIDQKAGEIISEAIKKGEARRREITEEARAEARAMFDRARREILLEKEKAMAELRDEVVGLAIEAAQRVLEKNVDSEANRRLVRDFIDGMGEVS